MFGVETGIRRTETCVIRIFAVRRQLFHVEAEFREVGHDAVERCVVHICNHCAGESLTVVLYAEAPALGSRRRDEVAECFFDDTRFAERFGGFDVDYASFHLVVDVSRQSEFSRFVGSKFGA